MKLTAIEQHHTGAGPIIGRHLDAAPDQFVEAQRMAREWMEKHQQ